MSDAAPLLSVNDVVLRFGGIVALGGVTFDIHRGQILGLIGPNGAGKTTMFNCISRLYTPTSGEIRFEGASVLDKPPHLMPDIGIGRTFQNVALFPNLTVLDNVLVGGHSKSNGDIVSDALTLPWVRRQEKELRAAADEAIAYLKLGDVAHRLVAGLPFGTQKRVELARALMARPKLLMMDEPAGGLNHDEVYELGALVKQIRDDRHMTVLIVEHHMGSTLR